jgi:hypothetical protein
MNVSTTVPTIACCFEGKKTVTWKNVAFAVLLGTRKQVCHWCLAKYCGIFL